MYWSTKCLLFLAFVYFAGELLAQNDLINQLEWQLTEAKSDTSKVNILNSLGLAYRSVNPRKGISYCEQAFSLAEANKYLSGLAISQLNLGIIYHTNDDYPKALDYYLKSLEYANKGQLTGIQSMIFSNLANLYYNQREYNISRIYAQRSIAISERQNNDELTAKNMSLLAAVERKMGNLDEALKYYNRAIELFDNAGLYNQTAATYNNIGNLYLDQKNYEKANYYYEKAILLYKRFNQSGVVSTTYANMSVANSWLENYKEATTNAYLALSLAASRQDRLQAYDALRLLYEKQKKFDSAYKYFSLFTELKDSLYSIEITNQINKMQLAYDKSAAEKELEKLRAENELKNAKILQQQIEKQKIALEKKQTENYLLYLETQNELNEQALKRQKLEEERIRLINEKQHEADQLNNRRLRNVMTAVVIGALIAIILAIFLNRARRKQKRAYQLTLLQKREIELQKEEILLQKKAIQKTNQELEQINQRVNKSIQAAQVIQNAFLPTTEHLAGMFADHFIIYRPKDVVSGDFYWSEKFGSYVYLIVADCTGHGVSGALMSMVGHALLDKIIAVQDIYEPNQILAELDKDLRKALAETAQDSSMDVCILRVEKSHNENDDFVLEIAAAKSDMYIVFNNELIRVKGDNIPLGAKRKGNFTQKHFTVPKGTICYMGSDGFADQNDINRQKIGTRRLQEMFLQVCQLDMAAQKAELIRFLEQHMEGVPQRDDILIVGVKL